MRWKKAANLSYEDDTMCFTAKPFEKLQVLLDIEKEKYPWAKLECYADTSRNNKQLKTLNYKRGKCNDEIKRKIKKDKENV